MQRHLKHVLFAAALALRAAMASAQVPVDVVHTFAPSEPASPNSVVTGPAGVIYGASAGGGALNAGTVFRVAADGAVTVVHNFDENLGAPRALVFAAGELFGLANGQAALRGAVFTMHPDGTALRVVHVFGDATGGGTAGDTLVRGTDGRLYGVSPDLANGRVYQLDPATDAFTVLHVFGDSDGRITWGSPFVAGDDGNVYGATDGGVIYRLTPSGGFTILRRFDCAIDTYCSARALAGAVSGYVFVELERGTGFSVITRLPMAGGAGETFNLNGFYSSRTWTVGPDGNMYAANLADIVRLTPQGRIAIVHRLADAAFDDLYPNPMTFGTDGSLVGVTRTGGAQGRGRIFRRSADGTFAWLHSLQGSVEGSLTVALVRAPDGTRYGTARTGGTFDRGTVFRIAADGSFTVLHSFTGGADGAFPIGLMRASDGTLYGTTSRGGSENGGLLFRVSADGAITAVHVFGNDVAVRQPRNIPMQASDGAFYGTTDSGIYRCTPDGTFALVHAFEEFRLFPGDPSPMRTVPLAELNGVLYGAVASFNSIGDGLPPSSPFIYGLSLSGGYRLVAQFDPSFDLTGALVAGRDGNLYGTAQDTFFRITTAGARTDLVSLPHTGSFYGRIFNSTLLQAGDGDFYCGFLPDSTAGEPGGICRVSTAGRFTTIADRVPDALLQRPDGIFEGANYLHGVRSAGTPEIFRFAPPQQMSLESPPNASSLAQPFVVSGWAIDRTASGNTGVDAVHVWAYPSNGGTPFFVGAAQYGGFRPDVMAVYGETFANSGFSMSVDGLPLGTYTFVVAAYSSETATFNQWRTPTVTVTLPPSHPAMAIDVPSGLSPTTPATVGPRFLVSGWALDWGASDSPGIDAIHVYAVSAGGAATFLGATTSGQQRPDVAAVYGAPFITSGYRLDVSSSLVPGSYTLVVYARSSVSGSWFWQTRAITVRALGLPLMALDSPPDHAVTGQPFLVAGWAIDLEATTGPGVDVIHVWAIDAKGAGTFVGATTTGGSRPDVGAAFGAQFATAGYSLTASGLAPGTYQLIVYAHSTVTDTFSQARVVTVTIAAGP